MINPNFHRSLRSRLSNFPQAPYIGTELQPGGAVC
jgi:hypothetical protein